MATITIKLTVYSACLWNDHILHLVFYIAIKLKEINIKLYEYEQLKNILQDGQVGHMTCMNKKPARNVLRSKIVINPKHLSGMVQKQNKKTVLLL